MDLTTTQWIVLVFTAYVYGFNKTGLVGSAIITTPLLLLNFTPGQSLGIVLPLLVIADITTVILLRHSAVWSLILQSLPWSMAGICLGWLLARHATAMEGMSGHILLKKTIAAVLVFLVLLGFYLRIRRNRAARAQAAGTLPDAPEAPEKLRSKTWLAVGMGILGGVATMLANTSGPAYVTYLMPFKLTVRQFLGTAAWLFLVLNVSKLPFSLQLGFVNLDTLRINLYLLPALAIGLVTGRMVASRISKNAFDNVVQFLALAGALYLLIV